MTKTDRTTVILAALVGTRAPGGPKHLVRKAIEMSGRLAAVSWLVVALSPVSAGARASFTRIGFLPNGVISSELWAVSADGSVAVGRSNGQAVRWTTAGLEPLTGGGAARTISADGAVVAGMNRVWEGDASFEIPRPPAPPTATYEPSIWGVSGDGSLVVGYVLTEQGVNGEAIAYRDGRTWFLGDIPGGTVLSWAWDANEDGSIIVGCSHRPEPTWGLYPVLWSEGTIIQLPDFPYATGCAQAISPDGTIVVGNASVDPTVTEAFLWDGGTVPLTYLPGDRTYALPGDRTYAHGTCADGSLVVGHGHDEAVIWVDRGPGRSLQEVLEGDHGLDLAGWHLTEARDVSDDCTTIVGFGLNPDGVREGFVVRFEPDTECSNGLDDDDDGLVDFPDDPACWSASAPTEGRACQDGVDNDGDGGIDFDGGASWNAGNPLGEPDPKCLTPWNRERRGCGLGFEIALALLILRSSAPTPTRRFNPGSLRSPSDPTT